ncbi:MAG: hypothetical protein NE330_12405 [Lentisphaeraceae bacterium]|nr:hypothetical protein [Lentisphaeraceae bacterium]
MAEEDKKDSSNVFSELTQVLKTLAKKINEQWTAMACFLAVLVTILCLTLLNSADQDKNENHILLTIVLFFSIILILGALIFYKKTDSEVVSESDENAESHDPLDSQEAFICFYKKLDTESLQHKILTYLKDEEVKTLPNISDALGINTATIRKSADRLAEKGFLTTKIGDKPKHVSYSLSYPLPK